jgi:hypothetical protein
MRYFLFLISSIFLFLFEGQGQVIIDGKIHNYDGQSKVYYHPTLEGIYCPTWKTVLPNSQGEFKIKYKNEGYGTADITFKKLNYRFFHDGNSRISFEIDQEKINSPKRVKSYSILKDSLKDSRAIRAYFTKLYIDREKRLDSIKHEATLFIQGDYQDVNNYYNRNIRSSYISTGMAGGDYYTELIREAERPERVIEITDSLINIEIDQINNFGAKINNENNGLKKANDEIKNYLENEIRAFYGCIFLTGMSAKRYDQLNGLLQNPDTIINVYNRGWEKLVESFFSEISERKGSG